MANGTESGGRTWERRNQAVNAFIIAAGQETSDKKGQNGQTSSVQATADTVGATPLGPLSTAIVGQRFDLLPSCFSGTTSGKANHTATSCCDQLVNAKDLSKRAPPMANS
uniref:Uncharacterized protein n=1 Tax=Trichuris muris TaxID=70415 RepID=A0A5S6QZQ9_TRIMR